MKLKILLAVVLLTFVFFASSVFAMTEQERQATIAQLRQKLAELVQRLENLLAQQQGDPSWCHTFNNNFGLASYDSREVINLHIALRKNGLSYSPDNTGVFSSGTYQAVLQFQAKYYIWPQTGYVGPKTRAKLNQLYGCGTSPLSDDSNNCKANCITQSDGTYAIDCDGDITKCSLDETCQKSYETSYTYSGSSVRTIQTLTGAECITRSSSCTPNWQCGSFTSCVDGQKSRTCADSNNCGTTVDRPEVVQSCSYACTPNWFCTGFGSCISGQQAQTCTDRNNCGTTDNRPDLTQQCTGSADLCRADCRPQSGSVYAIGCDGETVTKCSLGEICQKTYDTNSVVKSDGSILDVQTLTGAECVPPPVALSGISITRPANKLTYIVGGSLDITGLQVTGTYTDDSTAVLPITASNITGFNSSAPATKILTITYQGKTITYTVNIVNLTLSKIAVTRLPDKTSYYVGDALDITGLQITGTYTDDSTAILPITASNITGFNSSAPATKILTITYQGKTTTYSVYIRNPTLNSISITRPADKTSFHIGDYLDITGLQITGTYNNGSTAVLPITVGNIIGFNSSAVATNQVLTVRYEGKTTTYTVNIVGLASIAITRAANKTYYFVGESFDITGLQVTGTYTDDSTAILPITASNITGFSSLVIATKTLTITYQGKTTSYIVYIHG